MKQTMLICFFLLGPTLVAQKMVTRTVEGEGVMMINEIGIVVVQRNGKVLVDDVLPKDVRGKDAQETEIEKGDVIVMAEGKKISSSNEFKALYEQKPVGDEMKLGVQRGERLFLQSFKKQDPKDMAGGKRMVMRIDRKEGEEVLPALGLIIGNKGANAFVAGVLPNVAQTFTEFVPQKGDLISSLNHKPVPTVNAFVDAYDSLEAGSRITLVFSRNGKTIEASIAKPKPVQRMIMKQ